MINWKIINGYPDYAVSDTGQVKSLRYQRILKTSINGNWYHHVNLLCNKSRKTHSVHKLVIEHFGPIKPNVKFVVNHIDNDRNNNHIDNLEWISIKENTLKGYGNCEKKIKVKELRAQGLTFKKIAEIVGMSTSFVQDTIHDNNL